ncbi:DNA excision repair protein ERCC-8 [Mortierella sp. AM989]|nr:DNA excision repair protein ERCC-8 [Mortierella sp. AM989]
MNLGVSRQNGNLTRCKSAFQQLELGLVRPADFLKRCLSRHITDIALDPYTTIHREHSGHVNTIDIEEAEGRYLLSGGIDGNMHIYDLNESERDERRMIRSMASTDSLEEHKGAVTRARWYPFDNGMFTTSSFDSTVKVWDTNAMEQVVTHLHNSNSPLLSETNTAHTRTVNGVNFTPDGLHLVTTGHDDKMRLWNLYTGQNTLVNYGTMLRNQFVLNHSPMISPMSAGSPYYVFQASDDRSILMFDLMDGSLIKRLTGSYGKVTALAWRPRSLEMYSAGNDYNILVWSPKDTNRGKELRAIADQDTWSDSD